MSICHSPGGNRRFRLCAWTTLWLQAVTPVALSLTPVMVAGASSRTGNSPFSADHGGAELAGVATRVYVLKQDETIAQVAGRYGLTVAQLEKLNQFRVFAHGFRHLKAGDELDVPAAPLAAGKKDAEKPAARSTADDGQTGEHQLAGYASQAGGLLSSHTNGSAAASMAKGMAVSGANQAAQDWVSQFGTAQVQLSVDDDFSLKDTAFSLLHPWYDTPAHMVFSQTGIHRTDDRTQTNLGMGYRHFDPQAMWGVNTFLDYDLSRDHARAGLGGEYWRDFLKLSANGYFRLTGWKNSPDVEDYDERPANGWDLRAEGYLPSLPQLGAKAMFEQYYGQEVALFGKDNRQKNPHALTLGMSYTPVPLVTLGVDQKVGQDGKHDTEFKAEMNYRIGEPMSHQLDADAVAARRSLAGSRYDLIDRNNDIILEYRKQDVIKLQMPARVEGQSQQVIPLTLNVQAKHGLNHIEWDDAAFIAAGGKLSGSGTQWLLTLPEWKTGIVNAWGLSAVAVDSKNNASKRQELQVVVSAPAIYAPDSSLTSSTPTVPADGQSTVTLTAVLKDTAGNPVTGVADQLTLKGTLAPAGAAQAAATAATARAATTGPTLSPVKEDSAHPGTYLSTLTVGDMAGVYTVVMSYAGRDVMQTTVNISNAATAGAVALSADNNSPLLAGAATLTAVVTDANGKAMAGAPVVFSLSDSANYALSSTTGTTDENGKATVTLTSPTQHPGPVTVTATSGTTKSTTDVMFVGIPVAAVEVSADKSAPTATETVTLTTIVKDKDGSALADRPVTFRLSDASNYALNAATGTTDANGKVTVTLTSPAQHPGPVTVTATSGAVNGTADVTFSAAVAADVALTAGKTSPGATDTVPVTAVVKDASGVLLRNQAVTFSLSDGNLYQLDHVDGTTDADGKVTVNLTSPAQMPGPVTITATAGTASGTTDVTFVAATPASVALSADNNSPLLDGSATLTIAVKDANGILLRNQSVAVALSDKTNYTVDNAALMTDDSGTATAILSSPASHAGMVTVTATAGSAKGTSNVLFVATETGAVSLSADNASPAASDMVTLTTTVKDKSGAPLSGRPVTFSLSDATNYALGNTTGTTDANGNATVTLTSPTQHAGPVTVTATSGTQSGTTDVSFKPVVATAVALLADTASPVASDKVTLTAVAKDANGAALAGQPVSFSLSDSGNYALDSATGTTDGSGKVAVTLTSPRQHAGSVTVTATSATAHDATSVTFTALAASAVTLSADDIRPVASGSATLTAVVNDAGGKPMANQPVSFGLSDGTSYRLNSTAGTTDAKGKVAVTLTSPAQKAGKVTVTVSSGTVKAASDVTFVAATAADMSISADNTSPLLAGTATLTTMVRDANGNPLPGQPVSFALNDAASYALGNASGTTDKDGKATVTLTSPAQKAGKATVTVTSGTVTRTADVNFVAVAPATVALSADNGTPSVTDTVTLTGEVKDNAGTPLVDYPVSFALSDGAHYALGRASGVTDANGKVSVMLASPAQFAGKVTATATSGTVNGTTDVTFAAATAAAVTLSASSATPATTDTVTLTSLVKDANGKPMANQPVAFSLSDDTSYALASATGTTDGSGKATVTLTSPSQHAGKVTITATADKVNGTTDVTFAAATAAGIALNADNLSPQVAGTTTLTAVISDANGKAISGKAVTFGLNNATDYALGSTTATTDANGKVTVTVTSPTQKAGQATVTVTADKVNNVIDVAFMAKAAATVDLSADNAAPVASGTSVLTAVVKDAQGAAMAGYPVTFSLSDTNRYALDGDTVTTDKDGKATVNLTSPIQFAGAVTATAQAGTVKNTTCVTFAALPASQVDVAADKTAPTTEDTVLLTATVKDASGTPLVNQPAVFSLSDGAGYQLSVVNGTTDGNGLAYARVATAEQKAGRVFVTVTAGAATGTYPLVFADAAAGKVTLTADNTIPLPGDTVTLTATVTGASGALLRNQPVTFSLDDATNYKLGSTSGTTDANGKVTVSLTSPTQHAGPVTATVTAGSVTGTATATFAPATPATVTVTGDNNDPDPTATVNLTVAVKDGNGKALANQDVNLSVSDAVNYGLSKTSGTTDANGQIAVQLKSQTSHAGAMTVTATTVTGTKTATYSTTFEATAAATVEVTQDIATPSTTDTVTLTALVKDDKGNALASRPVAFAVDNAESYPLSATTGTTDKNGKATVKLSSPAQAAGMATVTATVGTVSQPLQVTLAQAVPATVTLTSVNTNPARLGNSITVKAVVKDAADRIIKNAPVSFALQDPAMAALSAKDGVTGDDGSVRVDVAPATGVRPEPGKITAGTNLVVTTGAPTATAQLPVEWASIAVALVFDFRGTESQLRPMQGSWPDIPDTQWHFVDADGNVTQAPMAKDILHIVGSNTHVSTYDSSGKKTGDAFNSERTSFRPNRGWWTEGGGWTRTRCTYSGQAFFDCSGQPFYNSTNMDDRPYYRYKFTSLPVADATWISIKFTQSGEVRETQKLTTPDGASYVTSYVVKFPYGNELKWRIR